MTRPLLLDLFSGAGGSAVGYHRAGFDVLGVDHVEQPRYPFDFVQGDALAAIRCLLNGGYLQSWDGPCRYLADFAAIHASPPCQRYSRLFSTMPSRRDSHPDLVGPTREGMLRSGRPWIIENVSGAPLHRGSVMLCGGMFGLRTYRHRWFEASVPLFVPPHPRHRVRCCKGTRRKEYFLAGGFISVVGDVGSYCGPLAMGIDWMTGAELSQAIPPAYCKYLGRQLLRILS